MKLLKKLWKNLIQALKESWEWLKRLFSRKKVEEEPSKPKGPSHESEEVTPTEEETEHDSDLLAVRGSNSTTGFTRVHKVNNYRVVQEHFQSLEHLIDCLSTRKKNRVMGCAGCDSSNESDSGSSLVGSYKSAVNLMRFGYTKILPRIEKGTNKLVKDLQSSYQRQKSILAPSFSGASPNVPRHLMGLPDNMLDRNVVSRKTKTIHIIYVPLAPWITPGDVFIKAGITLLSAIQLMENSGISVKLDCIFYAGQSDNGTSTSEDQREVIFGIVPLKNYYDRLNLQKLCFPIAHPAMLRRIGFRFLETTPELRHKGFVSSYGQVISESKISKLFKTNSRVVILDVITIANFHYNVESTIRYIKNAAER